MKKKKYAKKETKRKRNDNIRRAVRAGRSYRKVGKQHGVSGKRIFEIVNK